MTDNDELSNGEIARALARLEKSQGEQNGKLDEIKAQTTKTNGIVIRHEEKLLSHDREIRDLKQRGPDGKHGFRRASDKPDAMTVTISRNTVITIAIALGSFTAALLASFFGIKLPGLP